MTQLYMTEEAIVADYRQAKQKNKQIGILADLNQCKRSDIVEILQWYGEQLPRYYKPRSKPSEPADPENSEFSAEAPEPEPDCCDAPMEHSSNEGGTLAARACAVETLALQEIKNAIDELRSEICDLNDCVNKIEGVLALYESIRRRGLSE